MIAPTVVLCAWLVFGASHLLLGLPPLRERLLRTLGSDRFTAVFSAVAALGMGLLTTAVAVFGGEGPPGPALARQPAALVVLLGLSFAGVTLAVAGMLNYTRSPMALFRTTIHPPVGIERVTRHPFFIGLSVFAAAHALLAETLAVSIYFAGFAVLATAGAVLQDRKLSIKYGAAYVDYVAATSLLPFVAMLQGRQRITAEDRLLQRGALSAAIAVIFVVSHPLWPALHGATFAGLIAAGGVAVTLRRWRRARATARLAPQQ